MEKEELTEDEINLLERYQVLSSLMGRIAYRLAIEIIPPVAFVAIWFFTGSVSYLLVLITLMVFYNVQRILRQRKYIMKLNSISIKALGDVHDKQ
jgi:hypothetical protein